MSGEVVGYFQNGVRIYFSHCSFFMRPFACSFVYQNVDRHRQTDQVCQWSAAWLARKDTSWYQQSWWRGTNVVRGGIRRQSHLAAKETRSIKKQSFLLQHENGPEWSSWDEWNCAKTWTFIIFLHNIYIYIYYIIYIHIHIYIYTYG